MHIHLVRSVGLAGIMLTLLAPGWAADPPSQPPQPLVPGPVVRLVIDHPALAVYLHPEVAGRVPLIISDNLLAADIKLSKFGQPVRIVHDLEVGAQPHIRFLSFQVDGRRAKATIEYKVEGVQAVFILEQRSSGWWKVVNATATES